MNSIVITGSTRGIGLGLADAFLSLDCAITVSGRTQEAVDTAVGGLNHKYVSDRILGCPCDVTNYDEVKALWAKAKGHFGKIDIWINNAGIGHRQGNIWLHSPEGVKAVVGTNILGTMYGSMVALEGLLEQGHGSLYNMEGMGSDGRKHEGLAFYGTTKYAVKYFTDSLVEETKGTPIIVGSLRPGMVITDLIVAQFEDRPEDWEQAKRIFNVIADRVETVTPWLAQQILTNQKSGVRISWSSRRKLFFRFLTAPFSKRDIFERPSGVAENPE